MQTTNSSYLCKTGPEDKERLDVQAQVAIIPLREALTKWADRLDGNTIIRFLDFGCGVGSSMDELQKQFPKATYIGIDRSKQQVDVAVKAHSKGTFVVGDEKCKVGHEELKKADLVFMQFVVMHQTDLKEFFSDIIKSMKPGAQLLIFEPYSDSSNIKTENIKEVVEAQKARFKLNAEVAKGVGRIYNAVELFPNLLKYFGMDNIVEYRKKNMCFPLKELRNILIPNWQNVKENERFRSSISVKEVDRHIQALKQASDDTVVYLGDSRIILAQKPSHA